MSTGRFREAQAIVLDVGPTMRKSWMGCPGDILPIEAASVALTSAIAHHALQGKKSVEVAVVVAGTESSDNRLRKEVGSDRYAHVSTVQELDLPSADTCAALEVAARAPAGPEASLADACAVALDVLRARTGKGKWRRSMLLVTAAGRGADGRGAAGRSADGDANGDNVGNVGNVARALSEAGVELRAIVLGPRPSEAARAEDGLAAAAARRRGSLRRFVGECGGSVCHAIDAAAVASACCPRDAASTTVFRGALQIGALVRVPVWCFNLVAERRPKTLRKRSAAALAADPDAAARVRMERTYATVARPDAPVPPEDRVSAFRYGKELVPLSGVDEAALRWTCDACLRVLGFVERERVPRHLAVGPAVAVEPDPRFVGGPTGGPAVALGALRVALREERRAAVVRFVRRANQPPQLGCLLPAGRGGGGGLTFVPLPVADDLREYVFAELPLVTSAQRAAADAVVSALDLDAAETDGHPVSASSDEKPACREAPALRLDRSGPCPDTCANPHLQRVSVALYRRSQEEGCPVGGAGDDLLAAALEPHPTVVGTERARAALRAFRDACPVKRTSGDAAGAGRRKKRRYWSDVAAEAEAAAGGRTGGPVPAGGGLGLAGDAGPVPAGGGLDDLFGLGAPRGGAGAREAAGAAEAAVAAAGSAARADPERAAATDRGAASRATAERDGATSAGTASVAAADGGEEDDDLFDME
jgi:hypothetical protein